MIYPGTGLWPAILKDKGNTADVFYCVVGIIINYQFATHLWTVLFKSKSEIHESTFAIYHLINMT